MLGSIHFMKYGGGIVAAAIMLLLGTSVESHPQTGIVSIRDILFAGVKL
jgi:hypothetical protein